MSQLAINVPAGDAWTSPIITLETGAVGSLVPIVLPATVDVILKRSWRDTATIASVLSATVTDQNLGQLTLTVDGTAIVTPGDYVWSVRDATADVTRLDGLLSLTRSLEAPTITAAGCDDATTVTVADSGSVNVLFIAGPAGADGIGSYSVIQDMIDASMATAGLDEIGHGSVLPANGDLYDTYELQANGTAPDGMYRYDNLAFAWIQI